MMYLNGYLAVGLIFGEIGIHSFKKMGDSISGGMYLVGVLLWPGILYHMGHK